ncbi:hypothetical protein EV359DRAFT_66632 [Lentinula novae-zelandiae]|nr:hypothetical protein EV359DRAFT_66632 [Lentinula novae-zelandiae]
MISNYLCRKRLYWDVNWFTGAKSFQVFTGYRGSSNFSLSMSRLTEWNYLVGTLKRSTRADTYKKEDEDGNPLTEDVRIEQLPKSDSLLSREYWKSEREQALYVLELKPIGSIKTHDLYERMEAFGLNQYWLSHLVQAFVKFLENEGMVEEGSRKRLDEKILEGLRENIWWIPDEPEASFFRWGANGEKMLIGKEILCMV